MASNNLSIKPGESRVAFSIKKLGFFTVKGNLSELNGTIRFDENDLSNSVFNITVRTSTIDTNNEKRDEHLKNQDFFNVTKHPTISFVSTFVGQENGNYFAKGQLSILETTKEISIPFSFKAGVFEGHFSVNRLNYGLGKQFPSFFVGKRVQISIVCKTVR
ncbi:MAG: YceI family protein [Bacteroidota bacterium]